MGDVIGGIESWVSLVRSVPRLRDDDVGLYLRRPLSANDGTQGTAGSFLGLGSDGQRYYVKPINNRQCPQVCYTELAIARLGHTIGAPVCRVVPMRLTEDVAGWRFVADRALEPGIASASLEIVGAVESRTLDRRAHDDNARRQAGVIALTVWLGGYDPKTKNVTKS